MNILIKNGTIYATPLNKNYETKEVGLYIREILTTYLNTTPPIKLVYSNVTHAIGL
jgi:hypothetical protein